MKKSLRLFLGVLLVLGFSLALNTFAPQATAKANITVCCMPLCPPCE